MTLRRIDIVLEKLDSILSGFTGGDSLPLQENRSRFTYRRLI
jgi:hypothetical protein